MEFEAIESMVDLPTSAMPLKNLFPFIRFLLHTLIGVESTKDIPKHNPKNSKF
jgi:hypothetical protein